MPLLFSYGTLQQDDVQLATFGRRLKGVRDALVGFEQAQVLIEDPEVVATSGRTHHPIVRRGADPASRVDGTAFEVTDAEIRAADAYEVSAYARIAVTLASGAQAWVYAQAPDGKTGEAGTDMVVHVGGCHCGQVRFEVTAPARLEVADCNCTICAKSGFLHLIVPKSRFRLLSGADSLTNYQFNTGTARHLFCKVCGVKSFYVPRSHPDGYSVNARCLDAGTVRAMVTQPFNGQEWEANVRHLSGAHDS